MKDSLTVIDDVTRSSSGTSESIHLVYPCAIFVPCSRLLKFYDERF